MYCQLGASNPKLAMPTRGRVAPRLGRAPSRLGPAPQLGRQIAVYILVA